MTFQLITSSFQYVRLPIDRMRLFSGRIVFLVDLDSLVGFTGDQTGSGLIEGHGENAGLGVERSGLDGSLDPLKVVAGLPVPEVHRSVVRAGNQDPVGVGCHAVDDGVVSGQVL